MEPSNNFSEVLLFGMRSRGQNRISYLNICNRFGPIGSYDHGAARKATASRRWLNTDSYRLTSLTCTTLALLSLIVNICIPIVVRVSVSVCISVCISIGISISIGVCILFDLNRIKTLSRIIQSCIKSLTRSVNIRKRVWFDSAIRGYRIFNLRNTI